MKPKIIFVHGLFGSRAEWDQVRAFCSAYECVAMTLPGHGAIPQKINKYSILDLSQWLLGELGQDLSPKHFVGYSLGGRVLLSLYQGFPKLFKSLTLVSTSPGIEPREQKLRLSKDQVWADLMKAVHPKDFFEKWYEQDLFSTLKSSSIIENVLKERIQNFNTELSQVLMDSSPGQNKPMWPILKNIPNCLFIAGDADPKYKTVAQSLVAEAPNIKIEIVPKAGHSVHLERPREFAQILKNHLERSH